MKNPWTCDGALDVMFTDAAEFATASGRATVPCCVFPVEDVDPFADADVASDVKRINVLVRRSEWTTRDKAPAVGDSVATPDGGEWKVEKVDAELDWWSVKARSA